LSSTTTAAAAAAAAAAAEVLGLLNFLCLLKNIIL